MPLRIEELQQSYLLLQGERSLRDEPSETMNSSHNLCEARHRARILPDALEDLAEEIYP
jgi:hypothetical protein